MEPIILASQSPQRQEILKRLNIPFIAIPPEIDEVLTAGLSPEENVEQIAVKKAQVIVQSSFHFNTPWVIAADTLIFLGDKPLGKPANREEAFTMLRSYSGMYHTVITAICCYDEKTQDISTRISKSNVFFKQLSDLEIERYLSSGEWQGAAGAYRIQGLAACFITRIEGSYSGIVGLPIYELYDILTEHGYCFD